MNKKFSTLMASVLLASAFTANAQEKLGIITSNDAAVGDNITLAIAEGSYLSINEKGELAGAGWTAANEEGVNAFDGYAKSLWRIEKQTFDAVTGACSYQFVNKLTGQPLAIDLVTNDRPGGKTGPNGVSTEAAKISASASANKNWSFSATNGGILYAYKSDSVFYLVENDEGKLVLKSAKANKPSEGITLTAGIPAKIDLTADLFNALMKSTGNNGLLNFNGKDVTEGQDNFLKDTKWTAVKHNAAETNSFALTDGTTRTGYADDLGLKDDNKTYRTVNKKNYLQVDTLFNDPADNYVAFVKDTLPYEYDEEKFFVRTSSENKKTKNTRNPQAAKFTAEYWAQRDSIALFAQAFPELAYKSGAYAEPHYIIGSDETDDDLTAVENAIANAKSKANKGALQSKVNTLTTAVDGFLAVNPARTVDKLFNPESKITEVEAAMFAKNTNLTNYLGKLDGLKFVAGTIALTGNEDYTDYAGLKTAIDGYIASAPAGDSDNQTAAITKMKTALNTWESAFKAGSVTKTFKECTFSADGTKVADESNSDDIVTAYATLISFSGSVHPTADNIKTAVEALTVVPAKFQHGSGESVADVALGDVQTTFSTTSINYNAEDAVIAAILKLEAQEAIWGLTYKDDAGASTFKTTSFDNATNKIVTDGGVQPDLASIGDANLVAVENANATAIKTMRNLLDALQFVPGSSETLKDIYFDGTTNVRYVADVNAPVALRSLANVTVLTLDIDDDDAYVEPLIQPYATMGGNATGIVTDAKVYFLQVKNEDKNNSVLKASSENGKYLIFDETGKKALVEEVDAVNPYAQWAFIPGATAGYYQVINRGANAVIYTGPVNVLKDASDKAVANTYVLGNDTLKLNAVTLSDAYVVTEKGKEYDYSGAFYAGDSKGLTQSFAIAPASQYLTNLAAQYKSDSTMVLGATEDAPVWYLEAGTAKTYGLEIAGLPTLKKVTYKIYTKDVDGDKYYVYADKNVYAISKLGSENIGDKAQKAAEFEFRTVAENTYLIWSPTETLTDSKKMTINATPAKPILEVSKYDSEKNDYFTITKAEAGIYRKLTAEDGVLGNAKIHMENEPNRYLYENTANIVANNGTGHNFLGIYNSAELTKNAALYVDTAYVEREGNVMPQYMFALGVEEVEANDVIPCTESGKHFDAEGKETTADKCVHATPATAGYKAGRYLVALTDSVPENGSLNSPVYYDGKNVRLAFVPAKHYLGEDSLVIDNSKWTGNSKQITAGNAKTYASNDTLKIANEALNNGTFALLIKDQATKSFYLQTKNSGDNAQFVRILNGVPVLTTDKLSAAVFNIEATEENATANEAIAAEGIQVIGGKGAVTVQGAAGKVITVANILGQTIANQVAASDNVTIAVPAGIVVVAVEGEATKVVVK